MKMTIRIPIQFIVMFVCFVVFGVTENACLEIKQQQSIFYDIYVENAIEGMQMVY